MNVKDLVNDTINKAKNTKEFIVTTGVPDGFEFMGVVPFDLKISEGTITATVLATTHEEADSKFNSWLNDCTLGK
jgi:hypothetical protein